MDIESTETYHEGGYLWVVVLGVCIVVLTLLVAEALARLFRKGYAKTTSGDRAGSIFTIIIRVAVWALGLSLLLKTCLGLDPTVIWGALGVGGIALSLGLQGTISNLLGGLQISFSRDISIGDWVRVGSIEGRVVDITWRTALLVDDVGQRHSIPNSQLNSTSVTRLPEFMRVTLPLVIARDADLSQVAPELTAIADQALDARGLRFAGKGSVLSATGLGAEGITATLVLFSTWDRATAEVRDAALVPVSAYLREHGLLGCWR